jgi:hypothetical protein
MDSTIRHTGYIAPTVGPSINPIHNCASVKAAMADHITLVAMFIRAVAMLTTTAIRDCDKNVGIPKRKSPLIVQMGTDSRHTSERGLHQAENVRLAMNSNAQATAIGRLWWL